MALEAFGLLMVSTRDLAVRRRLLERETDGRVPDPALIEHRWSQFLELIRWSEGGSCRHDAICVTSVMKPRASTVVVGVMSA